ncbi:dihydrofolate reductase [Methylobacterium sp. Leaf99]|uniref:dihydrofolate reductase n=1 Tax=Methylobacterium sp. Leaf99 TaxID=1736251 RepID=UPI0009E6A5B4|nr:dihydrofolate reductase [Methylobacterium sp. Leaf99]
MKPIERPMPSISYIVARSSPGGVIGCENQLPWKLKTDMKFFRSVTQGNAVIMGRKTFESLGRPLPNRTNIILSTEKSGLADGTIWVNTPENALYIADLFSILGARTEIFVIGGAQIYKVFTSMFTKIYLTEVFHQFQGGDAFFRNKFDRREWDIVQENTYPASDQDEFPFRICVMEKKIKYTRNRDITEFYVNNKFMNTDSYPESLQGDLQRRIDSQEEQILLPFTKRVA